MQDFFNKHYLKILIPLPYFSLLFYVFTESTDKGDSVNEAFMAVLNFAPIFTVLYIVALVIILFMVA